MRGAKDRALWATVGGSSIGPRRHETGEGWRARGSEAGRGRESVGGLERGTLVLEFAALTLGSRSRSGGSGSEGPDLP